MTNTTAGYADRNQSVNRFKPMTDATMVWNTRASRPGAIRESVHPRQAWVVGRQGPTGCRLVDPVELRSSQPLDGRVGSHQLHPVVVVLSAPLALLVDALLRE